MDSAPIARVSSHRLRTLAARARNVGVHQNRTPLSSSSSSSSPWRGRDPVPQNHLTNDIVSAHLAGDYAAKRPANYHIPHSRPISTRPNPSPQSHPHTVDEPVTPSLANANPPPSELTILHSRKPATFHSSCHGRTAPPTSGRGPSSCPSSTAQDPERHEHVPHVPLFSRSSKQIKLSYAATTIFIDAASITIITIIQLDLQRPLFRPTRSREVRLKLPLGNKKKGKSIETLSTTPTS